MEQLSVMFSAFKDFLTFILLMSNVGLALFVWKGKATAPMKEMRDEMEAIKEENRVMKHEIETLKGRMNDNEKTITEVKEGLQHTNITLLAIMDFLGGKDLTVLNKARTNLQEYLACK